MSENFFVWALPSESSLNVIQGAIIQNSRSLDMPIFLAHMTLFIGKFPIKNFESLVQANSDIFVDFSLRVVEQKKYEPMYYKSCYASLEKTLQLEKIFKHLQALDKNSDYNLLPHVSLAYGNDEKDFGALIGLNKNEIQFSKICCVSGLGSTSKEAIESWEIKRMLHLSEPQSLDRKT